MAGLRAPLAVSAVALAAALAAAPVALGVPGGADGIGGAPSETASSYDAAAEYGAGVALLEAGSYAEAEAAFDKVVFTTPDSADARYMLGLARAGQEKLFPARVAYESALHYDENHIGAHRELGVTLARMGNAVRAQEELDYLQGRIAACAETCAEGPDLSAAAAAVEAAMGGGDQAALGRALRLALVSAEAGDAAYVDAVALINEARYEEAIATLRRTQEAFGPHPDVLTYLGFANRKLLRYAEAERYYAAALSAAPEHRGATEYLGELRVEQGNVTEARRLLARLETLCDFGCAEADELRRWIDAAS
jgi:tetratricopeptide (TPR) repeat protein